MVDIGIMKILLLMLILVSCASSSGRSPASPTTDLIDQLVNEDNEQLKGSCQASPPDPSSYNCSIVCIDGRWAEVCR